jgi:excisionase family DNA binding protein
MSALAFSPRAAAQQFEPSCGEATIRRAIKAGRLKTTRAGKRIYVSADELKRALEAGDLQND